SQAGRTTGREQTKEVERGVRKRRRLAGAGRIDGGAPRAVSTARLLSRRARRFAVSGTGTAAHAKPPPALGGFRHHEGNALTPVQRHQESNLCASTSSI